MRMQISHAHAHHVIRSDIVLLKDLATSALGVCTVAVTVYSLASIR